MVSSGGSSSSMNEGEKPESGLDAQLDQAIADIVSDAPSQGVEPDEVERPADGLLEDALLESEEEQAEAPEEGSENTVEYTPTDRAKARLALGRDGWTDEEIDNLPEEAWVARGLARDANQRTVDGKLAEAGRLRHLTGSQQEESNEGRRESDDSASAEFGDSQTAGANLASLAGPVVEAIEEGDTDKARDLLVELVQKAGQQATPQQQGVDPTLEIVLADRAQRRLEGRYEGDIPTLMGLAEKLGEEGFASDKKGLDRYDTLLDEALRRVGGGRVSQNNSTSRARRRRGSAKPISGTKGTERKPDSQDERLDNAISLIMSKEPVTVEQVARNL